jgi:UDP-N-acetylenolpyruvoylglucosamine reductase
VNPIFMLDGAPVDTVGSSVVQNFGAFTNTDAAPIFPTEVLWRIFVEGSVQKLDGGRLDLGVVRDSTLDATNDYETFVEVFLGIANRGYANSIIQVLTTLCPFGGSAGSVDAHSLCA